MFKIAAIQDEQARKEFACRCSTTVRDGCFSYGMYDVDTNTVMGFAQFDILNGYGTITDLKEADGCSDFEAMFILGKSTMNFIDLCGAHEVYAEADAGDNDLLKAIGFNQIDGGRYYCNMNGMFDGNCGK